MSRRVASPDADTPSYWPVFINCTISSDVLPILTFTLQPVCCSNGCTQSTFGSFWPLSAYPAQAMMFSAPSPLPTEVAIATLGGLRPCVPEFDFELLHAAARAPTASTARTLVIVRFISDFPLCIA